MSSFLSTDLAWAIALNNFVAGSNILTKLAVFGASYAQYFVILLVLVLAASSRDWIRFVLLSLGAAFLARVVVKESILHFVSRARPFYESSNIHALINPDMSEVWQSFPSGHSIFFFALATVIYYKDKKWGSIFFALAAFIGVTRVAVGVHYPTDILGGGLLGVVVGVTVYSLYNKFKK